MNYYDDQAEAAKLDAQRAAADLSNSRADVPREYRNKMKSKTKTITDKMIIRKLRSALREIGVAWEYVRKNSPLDYAITVPYCTIRDVIDAIKVRIRMEAKP